MEILRLAVRVNLGGYTPVAMDAIEGQSEVLHRSHEKPKNTTLSL